jgi:low temperature requirement protein LtrA
MTVIGPGLPEPSQGGDKAPPAAQGGDDPIRVTTLELFFDLIFAFTLTQLAVALTEQKGGLRVLPVLLIFGLLWWMYGGYAWLTNTRSPVRNPERLLLILGMTGFLIVGLAIPRAFGGSGLAFGLGYLIVVLVHSLLYARVNKQIWRIAPFNVLSALMVIGAGFVSGFAKYAVWVLALIIQACAPLVVQLAGRFDIRPAHFAERHGALIIVAIGESVAAIGIGAIGHPVTFKLVVASVAGLALSVTLWWMYFGSGDDEAGELAMHAAGEGKRPRLALSAYFYAHMPMLLGIVFAAAGVTEAVRHGLVASVPAASALGIGAAAFAGGTAAFRAALRTGPVKLRLTGAIFALLTVPLGGLVAIEAQLALLTAGFVLMLVIEGASGPNRATRPGAASAGQGELALGDDPPVPPPCEPGDDPLIPEPREKRGE